MKGDFFEVFATTGFVPFRGLLFQLTTTTIHETTKKHEITFPILAERLKLHDN
jgi:hypothetical protein